MEIINIDIVNKDGILVVSSRKIADDFKKQHKDILEKIDLLITRFNSAEKSAQYFLPSTYKDSSGKSNKEYLLTKKGFALIVNGFTGKRAFEFQVAYNDRFEEMENYIKSNQPLIPLEDYNQVKQKVNLLEKKVEQQITLDHGEQRKFQRSISVRVYQREETTGIEKAKLYSAIHRAVKDTFGVASYRDIKREEFVDALNFVANWIEKAELREYSA